LDLRTAARFAERYRLVAPKGPAGSVVFFHATTVHGSVPSMSPSRRDLALIAFNSVENSLLSVERPRPVFSASRTFEPVECCADDALLRL
jgi:ectoine hydroxylase